MGTLSLSERAAQDLIDIYLYTLEKHGASQAEAYSSDLEHTLSLLAENPKMGRVDQRLRGEVRRHEHDSHIIVFEESASGVLVLAVLERHMVPELHV